MVSPVIFFSGLLLPSSETFIRAQGEALENYQPYYVGSRFVEGLSLPRDRTYVINQGGALGSAKEAVFKLTGFSPPLYQKIRQLQPKLIHAHFGVCGALALPVAKQLGLPLVVTFHGLDATLNARKSNRNSLTHWSYFRHQEALKRETTLFITVSEFIKQKLLNQGFPPNKINVHYIGVDIARFTPDPAISRLPIVLFVGRLVEKKGCQYLIRAMAEVQREQPEVELVIIGDGPLRQDLEKAAKQSLKRYRFLGLQPLESVHAWMNLAQVFCVPSITAASGDVEAFGMVFAEAQAMGLPIVSFSSGGIPEAVAHEKTGFLAPERDWQQLAKYITQLLEDQTLWQRFSRDGQQRMQYQFDLHQQTRKLEHLYETILHQPQT